MGCSAEVTLVSMGKEMKLEEAGGFRVQYLPHLISPVFIKWLLWADVIHCHQLFHFETDAGILAGILRNKKVFASDLGGFGRRSLSARLPLQQKLTGLLLISEFSEKIIRKRLPELAGVPSTVISGGVDTEVFSPAEAEKSGAFLFVGRILPHKGIDYLIDALDENMVLDVAGRIYHPGYYKILQEKSRGKKVRFHHSAEDADLVRMYRGALAVIQPSVYETCFGEKTEVPELLGLAVLEGMACGAAAIVSSAGSLPELVEDGKNGFIVPPNDSGALRNKMEVLLKTEGLAEKLGANARARVLKNFNWEKTVAACMRAYRAEKP